jgi:hypothetical protein
MTRASVVPPDAVQGLPMSPGAPGVPAEPEREAVDVTLPNGRVVTLAEPRFATQFRVAKVLGEDAANQIALLYARALFYIVALDGERILAPQDAGQAQALANKLGERGLDAVLAVIAQQWPPVSQADLKVVKKTLGG